MVDPITLGLIIPKLLWILKIGGVAYLTVRVLKFERVKEWLLSRWEWHIGRPNILGFWMKSKEKNYIEKKISIFGFVDEMTQEILEYEVVVSDSIDDEFREKTQGKDFVYLRPKGESAS